MRDIAGATSALFRELQAGRSCPMAHAEIAEQFEEMIIVTRMITLNRWNAKPKNRPAQRWIHSRLASVGPHPVGTGQQRCGSHRQKSTSRRRAPEAQSGRQGHSGRQRIDLEEG